MTTYTWYTDSEVRNSLKEYKEWKKQKNQTLDKEEGTALALAGQMKKTMDQYNMTPIDNLKDTSTTDRIQASMLQRMTTSPTTILGMGFNAISHATTLRDEAVSALENMASPISSLLGEALSGNYDIPDVSGTISTVKNIVSTEPYRYDLGAQVLRTVLSGMSSTISDAWGLIQMVSNKTLPQEILPTTIDSKISAALLNGLVGRNLTSDIVKDAAYNELRALLPPEILSAVMQGTAQNTMISSIFGKYFPNGVATQVIVGMTSGATPESIITSIALQEMSGSFTPEQVAQLMGRSMPSANLISFSRQYDTTTLEGILVQGILYGVSFSDILSNIVSYTLYNSENTSGIRYQLNMAMSLFSDTEKYARSNFLQKVMPGAIKGKIEDLEQKTAAYTQSTSRSKGLPYYRDVYDSFTDMLSYLDSIATSSVGRAAVASMPLVAKSAYTSAATAVSAWEEPDTTEVVYKASAALRIVEDLITGAQVMTPELRSTTETMLTSFNTEVVSVISAYNKLDSTPVKDFKDNFFRGYKEHSRYRGS